MWATRASSHLSGIYKRGNRYVFVYRVNGKQHWESARTLDEARRAKSARTTDIDRGEFETRSRVTLRQEAVYAEARAGPRRSSRRREPAPHRACAGRAKENPQRDHVSARFITRREEE